MKKLFIQCFVFCLTVISFPKQSFSQSVAINADSSKADASAILDLKSTKKGLLIPRMTMAQRDAIASPATGLLIYQTDNTAGYYYYTGSLWTPLKSTSGGGGTGNYWTENEDQNIYNTNTGNVGIGSQNPASKLYVQTPLNTIGFTHLGLTDSIGTDSVLLADKLFSGYKVKVSGFTSTIPAVVSFGAVTQHALQLHAGDTSWVNLIPDGSVVIGKSAEYHGYYGSKLAVKSVANSKGISVLSDDGAIVSMYGSATAAGVGTFTSHDMNIYANSTPIITAQGSGNVGINTTTPVNTLQIGSLGSSGFAGNALAIGDGSNDGMSLNQSNSIAQLASSTNITFAPQKGVGNVGINTLNPQNQLQIGEFGSIGLTGAPFAIAEGNNALIMGAGGIQNTTNFIINANYPNGNVGISTHTGAQNKLQIGEMGSVGYNGNDLAIGNNNQATGIAQTAAAFQIASSTNIALLPTYGATGRVGINTTTPRAQLDVEGFTSVPSPEPQGNNFAYYGVGFGDFSKPYASSGGSNGNADVSIFASNNVMALEFDAFSDARIKSIIGISDSKKDLQTINSLQITDYSFKDKIKYGTKLSKKVIAQQVEKVYPQVVSKHVDFVPNVYQLTIKIGKAANGYLLSFAGNHNISPDAKKLQIMMEDNGGKKEFDIVSIPSSTQVIIKAADLKTDKLFVYGEEVDDFRTVDYEGLTTLNISATQELSKQVTDLQKTVAEQKEQIEALLKVVSALKQPEVTKK